VALIGIEIESVSFIASWNIVGLLHKMPCDSCSSQVSYKEYAL
jgi:hypothetical protein